MVEPKFCVAGSPAWQHRRVTSKLGIVNVDELQDDAKMITFEKIVLLPSAVAALCFVRMMTGAETIFRLEMALARGSDDRLILLQGSWMDGLLGIQIQVIASCGGDIFVW